MAAASHPRPRCGAGSSARPGGRRLSDTARKWVPATRSMADLTRAVGRLVFVEAAFHGDAFFAWLAGGRSGGLEAQLGRPWTAWKRDARWRRHDRRRVAGAGHSFC
jgi:hypothetical protein